MLEASVDMFEQQLLKLQGRLTNLYRGANSSAKPQIEHLPIAFKELGSAAEELQVAVEELREQNDQMILARNAVEMQRQRYEELFEFAPDGYLVIDPQGIIREANRAAARLFNVASQQFVINKPLALFVIEEERRSFRQELLKLTQENRDKEWEIRLQQHKGEHFDAAITASTVRNFEGEAIALRLCIRDITERKRAVRALSSNDYDPSRDRAVHTFCKGEIIPLKPSDIWLVCQGLVKLSTLCETAEEVLVGLAGLSMPFGLDLTALQTYQATALSEVKLVCISLTEIAACPRLSQLVLPQLNSRLRHTESLLAISGQRRVKDRLYHLLQMLKQEIGEPAENGIRLSVRFTHQDFADACSTTRVTITRILGKLQQQGKIIIDSKNHIILTSLE